MDWQRICNDQTRRVSGIDHSEAGGVAHGWQGRDGWSRGDPSDGEAGCPSTFARRQPALVETIERRICMARVPTFWLRSTFRLLFLASLCYVVLTKAQNVIAGV
jgi:hypothetical protein